MNGMDEVAGQIQRTQICVMRQNKLHTQALAFLLNYRRGEKNIFRLYNYG